LAAWSTAADGPISAMNFAEFQLQASGDPRLAAYATSPLPAWLWSSDGTRILWANPAGAGVFGAADGAALATRMFGPADQHRRQVARLAARASSGAIRLERLQGFGAAPGMLGTCGYQRIDFHDGSHGLLIAASAPPVMRERLVAMTVPETKTEPETRSTEPPAVADVAPLPAAQPAVEPTVVEELPEPDLESVLQLDLPHVEATPREPTHIEAAAELTPAIDAQKPSPTIEAVADEPANAETIDTPAPFSFNEPSSAPQRLPLRFTWQVDQDDRFMLTTDEFIRLIGPHTAAQFGRPWREISETFGLDRDGEVAKALAGGCRSNCRGCRYSTPRGISTAIAASASAAIPRPSPGSRPNATIRRPRLRPRHRHGRPISSRQALPPMGRRSMGKTKILSTRPALRHLHPRNCPTK
jgi:hypothetical protein